MSRRMEGAPVPLWLQRGLCLMLVVCGAISVVYVGEFSPLPVTSLLDAWIIVFLVHAVVRAHRWASLTLVLLTCYTTVLVLGVWLNGAPWVDFFQAYRWILYMVVFAAAVGLRWTDRALVRTMTWWLVVLAAVKSVLTILLHGPEQRPGLFLENNFELALFIGLAAVVYDDAGRSRLGLVGLLGLLTVLSGSRSGAVVYVLLVAYAMMRADLRDAFIRYVSAAVPLLMAVIPAVIFLSRAAESQVVDRVRFFGLFRQETEGWGLSQWLTGTPPITPLSSAVCAELEFYQALFSSQQDGTCYAVIFHAFTMRVLFDAGVLGLSVAFLVPLVMLLRSGTTWSLTLTLLGVALANSFSVSGLNSPYVALPILLAILNARPSAESPPQPSEAAIPITAGSEGGSR